MRRAGAMGLQSTSRLCWMTVRTEINQAGVSLGIQRDYTGRVRRMLGLEKGLAVTLT